MWDTIRSLEIPDSVTVGILILVAVWQVFRWIWDRRLTKDIEYLKAEFGRKSTVHKVQFETEFTVYRELWHAILKLKSLAPITPSVDLYAGGGDKQKELYQQRLDAAFKAFGESESIVELNKPFYSPEIYNLSRTLNRDCFKHLRNIKRRLDIGEVEECYDIADNLTNDTNQMINKIEQAIRERIGVLDKAQFVG